MRWGFIPYVASSPLGATAPRGCLTVVIEGTLFGTLTGSETCHEPDVNLTTLVSTGQSNLSFSSMAKGVRPVSLVPGVIGWGRILAQVSLAHTSQARNAALLGGIGSR
jgi:hypothetical protein